jgi:hypothetical protein
MRIFLLFLLMQFTVTSFTQVSHVSILPQYGNGFLVLNTEPYSDVVYWTVNIYGRSLNDGDSNFTYTLDYTIDLVGLNYLRINDKYWKNSLKPYSLKVVGYNSSRNIVVDSDFMIISDDPSYTEICKWKCVSDWYAYTISLSTPPSGGHGILKLESAYKTYNTSTGIGIPYFRYMSYVDFVTYCNSNNDTPPKNIWFGCNVDGINQHFVDATNANLHDNNGSLLTGTAVAIRKTKGPWEYAILQSSELIIGESECSFNLEWAIETLNLYNVINTQIENVELVCEGHAEPNVDFSEAEEIVEECTDALLEFPTNQNTSLFDLASNISECLGEPEEAEDPYFLWPFDLDDIIVIFLGQGGGSQTIHSDDLFNSNGEWTGQTISMEPGLYNVGLTFKDGSYFSIIKEVSTTLVSSIMLADFVNVNAFPNPFTTGQYDVEIIANAKVKFQYIVSDFNGNVVFSKNFVIQKGHSLTHTIKLKENLLNGTYINRLVFEDNSVKTFSVIKQ